VSRRKFIEDFPRHVENVLELLAVFDAVNLNTETSPIEYMQDEPYYSAFIMFTFYFKSVINFYTFFKYFLEE